MTGVSRGTVDRVIHHRGIVAEETRIRIQEVIDEYEFRPNPVGRALSSKKPYKIGVILIQENVPFFQVIKEGINSSAYKYRDYPVEVLIQHLPGMDEDDYLNAFEQLQKQVNAFVIVGYNTEKINRKVNALAEEGIPVITINVDLPDSKRNAYIDIDNYKGGQCLAGIVNEMVCGKTDVLLLGGHSKNRLERERLDGFMSVIHSSIDCSDFFYTQDESEAVDQIVYDQLSKKSYDMIVTFGYGTHIICDVIDRLHLNKKPHVFGIDLSDESKKCLKEGKISYIIDQSAFDQGYKEISYLCESFLYDEPLPQGNVYLPITIHSPYNL